MTKEFKSVRPTTLLKSTIIQKVLESDEVSIDIEECFGKDEEYHNPYLKKKLLDSFLNNSLQKKKLSRSFRKMMKSNTVMMMNTERNF